MKKVLIALAFCLGSTFSGFAQNTLSVVDVLPFLDLDTAGIIQPVNMTTQPFIIKAKVELSSISNVQNIHFKIGRQVEQSDVVNISIPYNYTTLPAGIVAITKEDNNFLVNFGVHTNVYTLHFEVWAEDSNGVLTAIHQKKVN